ncbi:MAG: polyprenyl synthetase family protein [Lachnospiraceae bacterium]|nr:polyprenyl synthetase family protein [Lachnospiraceae bacterium]
MENSVNFKEELDVKTRNVEKIIYSYLPKEEGFAKNLAEAMNYSMKAGGKRLRPLFMQETFHLFGGEGKVIEPFMAAMEMIHTHSLVHDDLPALDNDEYRRGKKTTHAVFGQAQAILCGDALLNYAYETAFLAFSMCEDPVRVGRALQILGEKAGIYGMLGGQALDVQNDGNPLTAEQLDYIYANKTSALIEGAMMTGAALAGASEEEIFLIESVGYRVGLAFQIQDDILDVTSTREELGKPVFSDVKNRKTTYVTLRGVEEAQKEVRRLSEEALETLGELESTNLFLNGLIRFLITRKK